MSRPLRVAVLITELDGSSFARCYTLYNQLEKQGRVQMLGRWQAFDADVAVFHRYWGADSLGLMESLQRHGVRVVVEVDDDIFNVARSNPAWHSYQKPEFRAAAKKVLKTVDAVFVSTANLASKLGHYCANVQLVPNAVDPELWPESERTPRRAVTVGFAGSPSHVGDLDLLKGVFAPLLREHSGVRLVCLGAAPAWLPGEIGEEGMRRVKLLPLVPVTQYPSQLLAERFDIGLAPLQPNAFNDSRSNLKLLEYALVGAATVASRVGPFAAAGLPLVAVANRYGDWFNALSGLVADAGLRDRYRAEARAYTLANHTVGRAAPVLEAALESLDADRGRVPFQRMPETFEPKREVVVVMPVHDAPLLARHAIGAVLPDLGPGRRLLIVDDGSELAETAEVFRDAALLPEVSVLRSATAGGFVAACNAGIKASPESDVILLNSDTRVPSGFIDRLRATAYSHPRYGLVTAATNNGSIASLPHLSDSATIAAGEPVLAPTSVGHCVYIRRDVLDAFGLLDPVFGKGYGEENDLSQRVRARFDSVIDPGCYVWHQGSASFRAEEKQRLQAQNLALVYQRYPHYPFEVAAFQASDPLRSARRSMLLHSTDPRRRVLAVAHSYAVAAGTELHIRDLALGLQDTTVTFVAAPAPAGRDMLDLYQGEVRIGGRPYAKAPWPLTPTSLPFAEDTWRDLIDEIRPEVIHLHHLLGHPLGLFEWLLDTGIPVVISVHDHYFLCPDYTLLDCPGAQQCGTCFTRKFGVGHPDYPQLRRNHFAPLLARAAAIVAPSADTAHRLCEVYPDLPVTVIPHGIHPIHCARRERQPGERLRFGFIGNLTRQKGANFITSAFSRATRRSPCELFLWGHKNTLEFRENNVGNEPHIRYNRGYNRRDLSTILSQIDVGVIPSVFPETFCYTLSEFSSAGLPCLVADLGSLGERVTEGVNGWKVAPGNSAAWEEAIVRLAGEPRLLDTLSGLPAVRSIEAMCADYEQLYRETGSAIGVIF